VLAVAVCFTGCASTRKESPPEHFRGSIVFFGDHIRFFPFHPTTPIHPKLGWLVDRSQAGVRGNPAIRDFEDRAGRHHYDGTMFFLDCSGVATPTGPDKFGFIPYTLKIHEVYGITTTRPKDW